MIWRQNLSASSASSSPDRRTVIGDNRWFHAFLRPRYVVKPIRRALSSSSI